MDARDDRFRLVACGPDGAPVSPVGDLPLEIAETCAASVQLYERVGFHPPWVSYVALREGEAVGLGAFVGPPEGGRVEIAYFTLPSREGQGLATRTAAALVALARRADPALILWAKTLPEPGPSTRILERLGFVRDGTTEDHEIGTAWAWTLR